MEGREMGLRISAVDWRKFQRKKIPVSYVYILRLVREAEI
jgi:hypothetical protein